MNVKDESLEAEIRDLLFERLNIDYMEKEDVDYDAAIFKSFDEDETGLGLDSVDALEMAVVLKDKYGLDVSNQGMDVFKSIRTIADRVRSMQA